MTDEVTKAELVGLGLPVDFKLLWWYPHIADFVLNLLGYVCKILSTIAKEILLRQ
jgi:hypothetical protein